MYHFLQESKEARKEMAQMQTQQNGMLPIYLEDNPLATGTTALQETKRELSWTGSEKSVEKKKHTLKGVSTTAKLVARLSPKSTRRKTEQKTALMKVILSWHLDYGIAFYERNFYPFHCL
jgi:hypothetical protein